MAIRVLRNMNFHGRDSARSLLIGHAFMLFFFFIIVVPASIITLHAQICNAQKPTTTCTESSNYTEGSTFQRNLKIVFERLDQGTKQAGAFNTSEHGQSPHRIYALFQCREDVTADQCYTCWQFAKENIQRICPNFVGGSIWPFHCFLRYENYNFFGIYMNFTAPWYTHVDTLPGTDTAVYVMPDFKSAANNFLNQLSDEAAPETKRSALGLSQKIYGLVQCTRDLSTQDCRTCLSWAIIRATDADDYGSLGVQYWSQGCIVRYQIYPFFNSTAHTPSTEIPTSCNGNKSTNKTPIILGVVGGLVLVLILCAFATGRRLKSAIFRRGYQGQEQMEKSTLISDDQQVIFKMETLLAATNNFHDDNKLGEGGFGPVYKGTCLDGKEIAVKKLSLGSMQGKKEFMNEIKLMAKIQHRNLVNLLGCCAEGIERLLVYEYLPNKSLDKILFDPNRRNEIDWPTRYSIIMGIARGLLYLHCDSQLRIIHRDIKASNVLLDENLNPKIADFGLARLFPEDETHVSTRVAGTFGYMPPEYAMQGYLSVKTDVYSFGVLLLEIITGRKNTDYNLSSEMEILLQWIWTSYKGGNIARTIDPAIIETCDEKQALRCIHVALLCTQAESSLRPPMSTVTLMLSTSSETYLPDPSKPAFVSSPISQNTKSTTSGLSHASATASSSMPSAR